MRIGKSISDDVNKKTSISKDTLSAWTYYHNSFAIVIHEMVYQVITPTYNLFNHANR